MFASHKNIKLYQMNVKNIFLNGFIEEESYIKQPLGFEDITFTDHVFKLEKAVYDLKQTLRAWYDRLNNFLIYNDFMRGKLV